MPRPPKSVWAVFALAGLLALWWWYRGVSVEPAGAGLPREQPAAAAPTRAPAGADVPPRPGRSGRGDLPGPEIESLKRTGEELPRGAGPLAQRQLALLARLREARSVESMQAAMAGLLRPRAEAGPIRAALAVISEQPEVLQREVLTVLAESPQPADLEEILLEVAGRDPRAPVHRTAHLALEALQATADR